MRQLALASVRHRLPGFLGSFLATVLAVALFSASGLLMFSALTAGPGPDRFAGVPMVAAVDRAVTLTTSTGSAEKHKTKTKTKPLTGAAVLPPRLAGVAAGTAGVAGVVADTAFPVAAATTAGRPVRGPHGTPVVAHGWASAALTPYTLRSGRAPHAGEAVVDAGVARQVGDRITVTTRTGVRTLRVSGIAAPSGADALDNQGALFVADEAVAAVSGLSGPTALAIRTKPGASAATVAAALRTRLPGVSVYTGDKRVGADLPAALTSYVGAISVFGIMLGVTSFAAVFVLIGCVSLVVRQRLRELALLRTIGATPAQLRRMLAVEAGAVSIVGGALGAVLGAIGVGTIAQRFRDRGVIPDQFVVDHSPFVLIGAVLLGVVIATVAARIAARHGTRIAPTEALRETATAPSGGTAFRVVAAVVTTGGAAAMLIFGPLHGKMGMGLGFMSCSLLLCAAAAAGPLLVRLIAVTLGRLIGAGGVSGWMAAANTRTQYRRAAAVAMPLMLMVGLTGTLMLNSGTTTEVTGRAQLDRAAPATQLLMPATGGVPLATATALAHHAGVRGLAATLPTTVMVDESGKPEHYAGQGLARAGDRPALDLAVSSGRLSADGIAVSADLASGHGWHVGDRVAFWLPDHAHVTLPVTAVYDRSDGFADMVLPAPLVVAHDPRGLVGAVYLNATARVSAPGLRAVDPRAAMVTGADAATQQAVFDALAVILLGFIAVSVANTFAIATTARRREYADLRLAGATPRQLHRMMTRETVLTVLSGLLLGVVVATIVTGAYSVAQDGQWRFASEPLRYAELLVGVGLLGLAAGIVPARWVIRRRALPAVLDPA